MHPSLAWSVAVAALALSSAARAETIYCTPINTLPTVIGTQGIYCLKKDLATSITTGAAITINANNVTIDLNGFKLGGLGGGAGSQAKGIAATGRTNITLRNGSVRGFYAGIHLAGGGSGHLIEDMRVEGSLQTGIFIGAAGTIIRRNVISAIGGGSDSSAYGIYIAANGVSVTDNVVDGVHETYQAVGIMMISGSERGIIAGNEVRDFGAVQSLTSRGIWVSGTNRMVIKDNYVVNTTAGALHGIHADGASDACIGNVVSASFSNPIYGCDYSSGNHVF